MEPVEYAVMFANEDRHWWYVGLRDLILGRIARLAKGRAGLDILDAGCGTGRILEGCRGHRAVGVDLSAEALPFLRRRGLDRVARASICRLPFADASFDVVASLDVLCCVPSPGDADALAELARVLRPGGTLLLNLPALEALRGHHDMAVHIRQRYSRGRLRALVAGVGLSAGTISYRNTFLLPAAASVRVAQRIFRPNPEAPKSDVRPIPVPLNRGLTLPLLAENRLIAAGVTLPVGLSLFCEAKKL